MDKTVIKKKLYSLWVEKVIGATANILMMGTLFFGICYGTIWTTRLLFINYSLTSDNVFTLALMGALLCLGTIAMFFDTLTDYETRAQFFQNKYREILNNELETETARACKK